MIERNAGLFVDVTNADILGYRGNRIYNLGKKEVIRIAYAMALDLHAPRVAAVALTPGSPRSEAMLQDVGVAEAVGRKAVGKDAN